MQFSQLIQDTTQLKGFRPFDTSNQIQLADYLTELNLPSVASISSLNNMLVLNLNTNSVRRIALAVNPADLFNIYLFDMDGQLVTSDSDIYIGELVRTLAENLISIKTAEDILTETGIIDVLLANRNNIAGTDFSKN